jgi:hypothetical protein
MTSHRIAAAALGIAALVATAVVAPTPTSAGALRAEHRAMTFDPVHLGHHGARAAGQGSGFNEDGGNWSGYAATGSGFGSISASWTEPAVSCNSTNDLFAPWGGIDGYGSSTVEQTGVATDCSSGSPDYAAWYEMYPAAPVYYSNPVAAGDHISASVTRSGSTYTLVLSDDTQGWSKTTTSSLSASNTSAEVIIESPTAAYPNFGSVNFTGSTVDGAPFDAYGPIALDASNANGFEDHTGPLSNGSFSITYEQE